MEVCPSCGDFTRRLNSSTGWCYSCSRTRVCSACGKEFPATVGGNYCPSCKKGKFDAMYEDTLRELMEGGVSKNKAREIMREQVRPKCLVCGQGILGGTKGRTFFCRKNVMCRKAGKLFAWLKRSQPELTAQDRANEVIKIMAGREAA